MAAFDFLAASVSLTYQIGTDDNNEPFIKRQLTAIYTALCQQMS